MASLRPLCFNSIRSPKRFILTPFHQFRNSRVPLQLQRCYRVDSNNRHELGFPSESKQQYQRFRKAQPPFYQSQRFWITMGTGGGLIGGYYVTHLETVPVTDRRRFIDVTLEQEEAMAKQAYREVMLQYGNKILSSNHPYTVYVRRIAERLIQVSGMQNLKWEFHVVDSPERNAFVLPGGKVFVFTGILPIVANEGGMAAVLGHEIAHQLARHSAEKLSFVKIVFALQLLLSFFIDPSFIFNRLFLNFGIMMPFSRKCEIEADIIGLRLMSQACFDPYEAVRMWERMERASQKSGEGKIPGFVSTHPAHKTRIEKLKKELPIALQLRAASDCSAELSAFADMFDRTWARW